MCREAQIKVTNQHRQHIQGFKSQGTAVFYSSLFSIWETCCDVAVHYTLYTYLCNTGEKHASDCCQRHQLHVVIFHQLQPVTFAFKQFFSYHLNWEQATLFEAPVFF